MKMIVNALICLNLYAGSAAAQFVQADSEARTEFSALCQGDALQRNSRTEARCSELLDIQIKKLKAEIESRRQSASSPPAVDLTDPVSVQPDIIYSQPTQPQIVYEDPVPADLWSTRPVEVDIFQAETPSDTLMVIDIIGQPLWDAPYLAQLGAFSTIENAQNAWQQWKSNVPLGVQNYQVQIKTKIKGGRTLYLLQIGPFNSKAETRPLCRELGNGCYAVQA